MKESEIIDWTYEVIDVLKEGSGKDLLELESKYIYDCSCFLVSFTEKIQENQVDKNFLVILTVKELVEDYKVTVIGNVYANPELKELVKG